MKNAYLFEINDIIANQIKLPYSTGLIWSHCILNEEIKNNYDLAGWFYYREDQEDILAKVKDPHVIGINCLFGITSTTNKLLKKLKEDIQIVLLSLVDGNNQLPIEVRAFLKSTHMLI